MGMSGELVRSLILIGHERICNALWFSGPCEILSSLLGRSWTRYLTGHNTPVWVDLAGSDLQGVFRAEEVRQQNLKMQLLNDSDRSLHQC